MINDNESYSDTSNCFLHLYGVFLGVSAALKPFYLSTRLTFFMCVILNLILATAYQSSLVSFLTKPSYEKQITTVEEILERDLEILFPSEIKSAIFTSWRAKEKILQCTDVHACLYEIAHGRKAAMIATSLYLLYNLADVTNDGRLMVHWLTEAFKTIPVHVYTSKGFPLRNNIDFYIFQVMQSGLQHKWMQDLQYSIRKNNSAINIDVLGHSDEDLDEPKLLNLDQLQGAFLILFIGLIITFGAFIVELIVYKKTKKQ